MIRIAILRAAISMLQSLQSNIAYALYRLIRIKQDAEVAQSVCRS